MATRRPAHKSQAEEMVENKRRMMRAELAETLGSDVGRKLHLNGESRVAPLRSLGNEPLHRNAAQADPKQRVGNTLRSSVANPLEGKRQKANGQVQNSAATSAATPTSPYARGKAMQPQATPAANRQNQLQPAARGRSGP